MALGTISKGRLSKDRFDKDEFAKSASGKAGVDELVFGEGLGNRMFCNTTASKICGFATNSGGSCLITFCSAALLSNWFKLTSIGGRPFVGLSNWLSIILVSVVAPAVEGSTLCNSCAIFTATLLSLPPLDHPPPPFVAAIDKAGLVANLS